MNKYIIQYGIGGGFNNTDNYLVIEAENEDIASSKAYYEACDIYDRYLGTGGLRDVGEIMEDENCSEDEATEIFNDEREDWIDYSVELFTLERAKEIEEDFGLDYRFKY